MQNLEFSITHFYIKQHSKRPNCVEFEGFDIKKDFRNAEIVKLTFQSIMHICNGLQYPW